MSKKKRIIETNEYVKALLDKIEILTSELWEVKRDLVREIRRTRYELDKRREENERETSGETRSQKD